MPKITVLPDNRILEARPGQTLHGVLAAEGLLDAPCGGQGTCGKCKILVDGREALACRTPADRDMTVTLPRFSTGAATALPGNRIAFDIGTTTLVCCLVDRGGNVLSQTAARNPQAAYGADVISRIQAANSGQRETLTRLIREEMTRLLLEVCSTPEAVEIISVVGNPAMQQLFLGMDVKNLSQIPYKSVLCQPNSAGCRDIFPICPKAKLLTVPDISAFVGADTVAGILSWGLHEAQALTLLVDIGTNGEMVLGNKHGMVACATAAGPALEGASIQFGMRAEPGAIHRVWVEDGKLRCGVMGNAEAKGICGSGLIDAIASALDLGLLDRRGKIAGADKIMLTDRVYLTQADIRQVQLAKGAIRAGIDLLAAQMGVALSAIETVVLAGAFGSHLDAANACRMGLLPEELLPKIRSVGNAAGRGAVLLAAHPDGLKTTERIVKNTEYLDLSTLPAFPKAFAKAMELPENWVQSAQKAGFTAAAPLDPACLQAQAHVRAMCAQDKCGSYGRNWTCPPHCGTTEECQKKMQAYSRGILLQTQGQLSKAIDSRAYRQTEQRHLESFARFCQAIRRQYPDALCLGAGGCRVCKSCAWPEPCRFPEKAVSSMEAYGLFVTQVCRDAGLPYYYGEKTITYTACVLFD